MHKPLLTLCLTLITLTAAAEVPPDAALMQQAEGGDAEAQFLVGRYYMHQDDWANAMPWFDKAAAQGHPTAGHTLQQLEQLPEVQKQPAR